MPAEEKEGEGEGEVGEELGVRRGHAVAFAVHFCYHVSAKVPVTHPSYPFQSNIVMLHAPQAFGIVHSGRCVRFGLSSLINLFSKKFNASHPICPANINRISTSRVDHIRVT